MKPLVAVVGPTGSGKSALALCLAQKFGGEIVNCDSLQLYRGFDIGTAKTPARERRGMPHHLFDVLTAAESYSAGEYARAARKAIAEISARGRLPVVVGGTGFYLRALIEGLPALPGRDEALRGRLMERERARPGTLHRILGRLDAGAAGRIHERDTQKTLRALEVRLLTRRALPAAEESRGIEGYTVVKLGLDPDRAELQRRLEARTRGMFALGLMEEVRGLLEGGATGDEKPFEALGYKQAVMHLRGAITLEQAVESTIVETRQYAKRQRTWFRRDAEIRWLEGFGDESEVMAEACSKAEIELKEKS
ncbi:MAG: tRNA (adenosine(37)-N6)-dimethylallyltransferase MiaA [Acidobacteriota bacterium]|nr:tRNA (adenosine(37)-N6)-dimethylallyltransferase MiaA [Acidobacteriota bacterium]